MTCVMFDMCKLFIKSVELLQPCTGTRISLFVDSKSIQLFYRIGLQKNNKKGDFM